MSERVKDLLRQGALSVTVKATQTHTVVIARMPDDTYKATGSSVDVALDRCLEKVEKHAKNIKKMRRQKERERQEIMEALVEETDDDSEEEDGWDNKSNYREVLDWD